MMTRWTVFNVWREKYFYMEKKSIDNVSVPCRAVPCNAMSSHVFTWLKNSLKEMNRLLRVLFYLFVFVLLPCSLLSLQILRQMPSLSPVRQWRRSFSLSVTFILSISTFPFIRSLRTFFFPSFLRWVILSLPLSRSLVWNNRLIVV